MTDQSNSPPPRPLSTRFKFGALDAGAVARAEAALQSLSSNFDQWIKDELAKIEAARDAVRTEGLTATTAENLYFRAHDLKGLGATYGFPLVTRMAGSLCRILHDPQARLLAPMALIEAHVEAIGAVVRNQIRDDNDPTCRTMADELEAQAVRISAAA